MPLPSNAVGERVRKLERFTDIGGAGSGGHEWLASRVDELFHRFWSALRSPVR